MSPYLDRLRERVGGHTIVDSGLLGLMLLRAGWFVYAALDLEYSPGVLPHGMVRITLLEQVRNRQGLPDPLPQPPASRTRRPRR